MFTRCGACVGVAVGLTVNRGKESWIIRTAAVLAIAVVSWVLPTTAGASSSASFDDPIGDVAYYAPDLGATTVTIGDDETVTLDTRIVPRPPAYWGGCAYTVGAFPYQTCVPANMNVTWYLDFASGAGSVADGGADAKVVAIPSRGQTFWESARWDTANGKFSAGAKPAGTEDSGGAGWRLNLADLGVPRPATVRIWVVSLYKSYNGLGTLLNYSDEAGPGTVSIAGLPAAGAPDADRSCTRATNRVNRLQRRIRAAKRRAARGSRSARKRLARLRSQRKRALRTMKRRCGSPVRGTPPTSAPPGCRLVTKTVLKQEGIGIYAQWVLKPEVVVECTK
jgi:hypothetical protein